MVHSKEWTLYFLDLAHAAASKSKDPSTRVGAVIVRPDKTIASIGFNGFPRGICDYEVDLENREEKYKKITHAEMNAILHCRDQSIEGYSLYVDPLLPCVRCAVHIIQAGIKHVIVQDLDRSLKDDRWKESAQEAIKLFEEAGVSVHGVRQCDAIHRFCTGIPF